MLEGRRGVTFADRVAVRVTQALQGSASWNASTSGTRVGGGWSGDHHAAVPMPAETSAVVMMRIQQRQRVWRFSVHARTAKGVRSDCTVAEHQVVEPLAPSMAPQQRLGTVAVHRHT